MYLVFDFFNAFYILKYFILIFRSKSPFLMTVASAEIQI